MADRKPQEQDKYVLRLPDGMRERIRRAAERNNRSMNAEIVATLEEKYPPPPQSDLWLFFLAADLGLDLENLTVADLEKIKAAVEQGLRPFPIRPARDS